MKNVVFTLILVVAQAGCGGGGNITVSTAKNPDPPNAVAPAEPKPQQPGHANPELPDGAVQLVQHEPIMKPTQVSEAKIVKTDAEWRAKLTPEEYRILRRKGTERAFTGKFDHHFKDGTYTCKGCGTPLFLSDKKYNSGCGWPAFYQSINGTIDETHDTSHGMIRVEITCKKCGGHLGHIFDDGPNPTGIRYCVNSASMDFIPAAGKVEKRE